jgi:membrane-associated protease RseP (regulator of RpoE activity)
MLDRPPTRTTALIKHAVLFLVTFCTTTIAGVLPPFGSGIDFPPLSAPSLQDPSVFLSNLPTLYALFIVDVVYQMFSHPAMLLHGISFSLPLLFILFSHEMGHYIACRIYRVDCTLPYFIPTPPMVAAGTFGALIRIKSPMYSRRVIFDIGVAGPIAGFIALIPVAIAGIALMEVQPPAPFPEGTLVFTDPLFMRAVGFAFGKNVEFGIGNPFYFAAWIGLLVTALNLIPSGQLDGGHALFAALGKHVHFWTGRVAFVAMMTMAIVGIYVYQSPAGFVPALLLGFMMYVPHPEPVDQTPLDMKRRVVGVLTVLIFILSFAPIPIQIT